MSDLMSEARVRTRADLAYESLYCAAIGGSVIALFFLMIDAYNGQPLFTPSLLGGVLFGRQAAETITEVRIDWVAYATILHFIGFTIIGTAVAIVAYEVELHSRHPATVLFGVFAAIEWIFLVAGMFLLPGVISVLGFWRVAGANLLAAAGIATFLWANHQPEAWERFKNNPLHLISS
jgi:hypothetical protein